MTKKYEWCDSSGRLNLTLTRDQFESGAHQGDCEDDVRGLMRVPEIAAQIDAWDIENLRKALREYGAWDETELADEDMCRVRMLWLACCDLKEENHG